LFRPSLEFAGDDGVDDIRVQVCHERPQIFVFGQQARKGIMGQGIVERPQLGESGRLGQSAVRQIVRKITPEALRRMQAEDAQGDEDPGLLEKLVNPEAR
jgi:hypothetical protein